MGGGRVDGLFVLRTNTDQPAHEVARLYKGLWRVERAFREVKTTLECPPNGITTPTTPASDTWWPAVTGCTWKRT